MDSCLVPGGQDIWYSCRAKPPLHTETVNGRRENEANSREVSVTPTKSACLYILGARRSWASGSPVLELVSWVRRGEHRITAQAISEVMKGQSVWALEQPKLLLPEA